MRSDRSRRGFLAIAAGLSALSAGGCSTDRAPGELFGPSEAGLLVVDAHLIVDADFPDVWLSRASSLERPYSFQNAAEGGATVRIRTTEWSLPYREDPV